MLKFMEFQLKAYKISTTFLILCKVPVMCTTTERKVIKDDILACRWSSCSEWCLSKGGGACTHLYVRQVTISPY